MSSMLNKMSRRFTIVLRKGYSTCPSSQCGSSSGSGSSCGGDSGLIKKILARQIYDSRGNPTVEVDLETSKGCFRAAVPSGASTGAHEAVELRDNDKKHFHGKGVTTALKNINECLGPKVIKAKLKVTDQAEIDKFMIDLDGTDNKGKLGANSILGISLAVCKAGAGEKGLPLYKYIAELACNKDIILPTPSLNVINGGSHAGNKMAIQELMIMPTGACNFCEAMKMASEVYHHLKAVIKEKYGLASTAVGDEGGFSPNIQSANEGLDLIKCAISKAGHTGKVEIAFDAAASEFFKDGKYDLDFKNPKSDPSKFLTPEQLSDMYLELIKEYKLVFVEDPYDQDDWASWKAFAPKTNVQIIADDITVTNRKRIQRAIDEKSANCLLLKVNQIGTVTESIDAHKQAKEAGWGTMVSHRSGETEDAFIADLVVGLSAGQIKTGAPCRSERLAKYNQILRIEKELGCDAKYAGKNFRNPQGKKC